MLNPISQSLFSYTLAPIQSICRNHPTAVAVFATLFFATQVHAQPNNEDTRGALLERVTNWMGEDTALKVGAFTALLLTVFVIYIRNRKSTPLARSVSSNQEVHTTTAKKRVDLKAPNSDPTTAVSRRSKAVMPKPQTTSSDAQADKTYQERMQEYGAAETPGGINITPDEMRENGIKALREGIQSPQRQALISYTLAAHLMMLGKYKEAKEEGKRGYKYVEADKITGEIKTHLPLLIQQCNFLIAQPQAAAPHKQKSQQQVPETPGVVNLTPEEMRDVGIKGLLSKFSEKQKGILYYIFAADLMSEGRFLEAKEETKRGIQYGKTIELLTQYQLCDQQIKLRKSKSSAPSNQNSNNNLDGRSSILKKPLPPIPQEDEVEESEVRSNAPLEEEELEQQQREAFPGAPPPPTTSFDDWQKQSKTVVRPVETKKSAALNGKVHKLDPSSLPIPPQVVNAASKIPPPPTPSKLPPPPSSAVEPKTEKTTTKGGEKSESTQAPKSVFAELTQRTIQENGGLKKPAESERPKIEEGPSSLLKEIEGTGKKALKAVSTPPTVARTKKKAALEKKADEEAKKDPLFLKFKNARPQEGDAGDDDDFSE